MNKLSNKIEKLINIPKKPLKMQKIVQNIKIKLYILNCDTLQWISMPSSIKCNLEKLICKCA